MTENQEGIVENPIEESEAGTQTNTAGSAGPEETAGSAEATGTAGSEETAGSAEATGSAGSEETAGSAEATGTAGSEETAGGVEAAGAGGSAESTGGPGFAGTDTGETSENGPGAEHTGGSEQDRENESHTGGSQSASGPLGYGSEEETGEEESVGAESGEDESGQTAGESYIIGEDGETQVVFDAEPETEYIVSTPASAGSENKKTNTFSKTYSAAAGAITKTAQSAAKSAAPALKTIGFNIVNAVLIAFIGVQIARFVRKMLNKTFEKIHMDASLRSFLTSVIYVLIIGVAGFMALERVGVSSASIIAILGSAGLAVSLSLQDFLGNFAGGVIILCLKPFRPGDYIVCGTAEGTVLSTSLFYTTLDTVDNRQMILPNGALSNANIINVTAEPRRRLEIRVDISYDSDIRTAKEIMRRLFDEYPDIIHEEEVVVFVDSLGESGITLVARGWIAREKYWAAKWQLTEDLKYAYDEAGIVIPYRQVVVHMGETGTGEDPDSKKK